MFFFFKQKTAYEMRISDWSSDVCSSDLDNVFAVKHAFEECAASLGRAEQTQRAAINAAGQIAGGARVQQPAFVQQENRVAFFRLVEIGGRPEYSKTAFVYRAAAIGGEFLHHRPQFATGYRIDADAWLIEQQQPRRFHQRAGESQFLLHAARKLARQPVAKTIEIGKRQQPGKARLARSEEHTSELQSLMRISYAVFCLKKKKNQS